MVVNLDSPTEDERRRSVLDSLVGLKTCLYSDFNFELFIFFFFKKFRHLFLSLESLPSSEISKSQKSPQGYLLDTALV